MGNHARAVAKGLKQNPVELMVNTEVVAFCPNRSAFQWIQFKSWKLVIICCQTYIIPHSRMLLWSKTKREALQNCCLYILHDRRVIWERNCEYVEQFNSGSLYRDSSDGNSLRIGVNQFSDWVRMRPTRLISSDTVLPLFVIFFPFLLLIDIPVLTGPGFTVLDLALFCFVGTHKLCTCSTSLLPYVPLLNIALQQLILSLISYHASCFITSPTRCKGLSNTHYRFTASARRHTCQSIGICIAPLSTQAKWRKMVLSGK